MSKQASQSEYALHTAQSATVAAPALEYRVPMPQQPHRIGLIGCGGISAAHLEAYKALGLDVVWLCDRTLEKAVTRRAEFFPNAQTTTRVEDVLESDVDVVDITTHPLERVALLEAAIHAKKHVLSQKPFVLDLAVGERLCDFADEHHVVLAVNQNGRFAPHLAYMRQAVIDGLIGTVQSVHISIHWDHTWTAGTPFEEVEDLILLDFGVHWFDFVASVVGSRAKTVCASRAKAANQSIKTDMLAQVLIELEDGQASLIFDAHQKFLPRDTTYIGGTHGSLISDGANLGEQTLRLETAHGLSYPVLGGKWFNDAFGAAMCELLCAVEQNRQPLHNARDNLKSLELVFAAIQSSKMGKSYQVGEVRRI
jgi:predicted dehydrogenase